MNKVYNINEIIFRQGDAADSMFEIVSGSVGIYVNYGESNEKLLTTLDPGKTFGEMGMIEKLPRSATAVAASEDTRLEMVTSDDFAEYFREHPDKVLEIMAHMSSRIRSLTTDYLSACRAIAESEEASKTGKKSSWLKEHIKGFIADYTEAVAYMNQHPELFSGHFGHHDHYHF